MRVCYMVQRICNVSNDDGKRGGNPLQAGHTSSRMTEFLARRARADDVEWIEAAFPQMGSHKPEGYFGELVRLQARDAFVFLVAEAPHGEYAGHLKLIWEPDYPGFRERGIPEIQTSTCSPSSGGSTSRPCSWTRLRD